MGMFHIGQARCELWLAIALATLAAVTIAPLASAETTLEATEEPSAEECPDVSLNGSSVSGGCVLHLVANDMTLQLLGVALTACAAEVTLHLNENANGYATGQALTGGSCSREACTSGGSALPWPVTGYEASPGTKGMRIDFCFEPIGGGAEVHCDANTALVSIGHAHTITALRASCQGGVELSGTWAAEEESVELAAAGELRPNTGHPTLHDVVDFGSGFGPWPPVTVTYTNNTGAPITISAPVYTGTSRFQITGGTCTASLTLPKGASCTVIVSKLNNNTIAVGWIDISYGWWWQWSKKACQVTVRG